MENEQNTNQENLSTVDKEGLIQKIEGNTLFINISCFSACSNCHAKGACTSLDVSEKIIEADVQEPSLFHLGQKVKVSLTTKMGFWALGLGIFFPFLLLVFGVFITYSFTQNEGLSAIISLFLLIPYYTVIYLLRNRLKNKFFFKVEALTL